MNKGEKATFVEVDNSNLLPCGNVEGVVEIKTENVFAVAMPHAKLGKTLILQNDWEFYYAQSAVCGIVYLTKDSLIGPLFANEKMKPKYNVNKHIFEYTPSQPVLEAWKRHGMLKRKKESSFLACPKCESMTMTRRGCEECWSANLTGFRLVRHKECGYIGLRNQMENNVCLKCNKDMDDQEYESIDSPCNCADCHHITTKSYYVCECLECGKTVPIVDAKEISIFSYKMNRK